MKILFVASECAPLAKVGGLADIVGALPKELFKAGLDVSVLIPFYDFIKKAEKKEKIFLTTKAIPVRFYGKDDYFDLWKTYLPGSQVPLYLADHQSYFKGKSVYLEADASSGGSLEEAARFLFLSKAAIQTASMLKVDILHCHDWQTAIAPFLIKKQPGEFGKRKIKTLLTIHNLAYQGIYPEKEINKMLETDFTLPVNCLILGILSADFLNTVSPAYAREILTSEYGWGLESYLRQRASSLTGILNGLDIEEFNPQTDKFLEYHYSRSDLSGKTRNKEKILKDYFPKTSKEIPLIAMVSRLAEQKGINLIQDIFEKLMGKEIRFFLLGQGLPVYQNYFLEVARKYSDKFCFKMVFNEGLARQIYSGADMFLMPSQFEPCGLGQQIAMRYGAVPVARATGGIKDTVAPVTYRRKKVEGTGFLFRNYKAEELLFALEKALTLYSNKPEVWRQIQINAMEKDFSWNKSVKQYISLYKQILRSKS